MLISMFFSPCAGARFYSFWVSCLEAESHVVPVVPSGQLLDDFPVAPGLPGTAFTAEPSKPISHRLRINRMSKHNKQQQTTI